MREGNPTLKSVCQLLGMLLLGAALARTNSAVAQTPPPDGYNLTSSILSDPAYVEQTPLILNDSGLGIGTASQHIGTIVNYDRDVFFFSAAIPTQVINLTGTGYEKLVSGKTYRLSTPIGTSENGQVLGESTRYAANGDFAGQDAWLFNGLNSTQVIGLTGPSYESAGQRYSQAVAINDSGMAIGASLRGGGANPSTSPDVSPFDVWIFNGSTSSMINPTGSVYEATNSSGSFLRSGVPVTINNAGQVIGFSFRYGSDGQDIGYDAWEFSGAGPAKIISLTGSGYDGTLSSGNTIRESIPLMMNATGQVVGRAEQFSSAGGDLSGFDIWLYDGTGTTKRISLTGSGYQNSSGAREAGVTTLTDSGQVIGVNHRYNFGQDAGNDAWYYNGSGSAQVINLAGTGYQFGSYRNGQPQFVNASGVVTGYSSRYANDGTKLGQDAWLYIGSGATKVINLTGGAYERSVAGGIQRQGQATALNALGQSIGTSTLYTTGSYFGQDVWFNDGVNASYRIDLSSPRYLNTNNVPLATPVALNNDGQAIGYNTVVDDQTDDTIRQPGWFFDKATGVTTPLEFSFDTSGNAITQPLFLMDTGVVLGDYDDFSDTTPNSDHYHAFWWSMSDGFHDLGDLINGGLNADGFRAINGLFPPPSPSETGITPTGAPAYILAIGTTLQGIRTDVLLSSPVPEPINMSLLVFGFLLARRGKSSRF